MTDTPGWVSPSASGTDPEDVRPSATAPAPAIPGPAAPSDAVADGVAPGDLTPGEAAPVAAASPASPAAPAAPLAPSAPAAPPYPGAYGQAPAAPTPPPAQGWGGAQPGWGAQAGWGQQNGAGWGFPPPSPKPGVIPLRPLGVGEILDGSISTVRKHWRTALGLSLVVAVLSQIVLGLVDWWSQHDAQSATTLVVACVGLLVSAVAGLVMSALLTVVVSRAVLGEAVSVGEAWRSARPQLWRLAGLSALIFLIMLGIFAAAVVPAVVVGLATGSSDDAAMVALPLLLAAFVVAIRTYFRLSLAAPALMLERQGIKAALSRSRKLVHGSWWRIFGISVLSLVLTAILASMVGIPFRILAGLVSGSMISGLGGDPSHPQSVLALVVVGIGGVIGSMITAPVQAGVNVLLYVDQRIRREALDLELARAAGLPEYGGTGWARQGGGAA
ncbi:DUF7544 domain-containing protein [Kitasatospora sp. NBC_01266]|uniref:DUF7544 domain-containing protein n=1 Tax=Kitasatospora sp. NBC_01266 TaxID=2903572 RepID=UPI002E367B85|nr:hypothetical protein [Kitasatospora sp. NBC_01266]